MGKIYTCICGETFTKPNKFNSHKNHCKVHIEQKYGSYEIYKEWCQRNKPKKEVTLKQWISEYHKCECCGKVMTEKYGRGRFCCRSCANTRKPTQETKDKIGFGVKFTGNRSDERHEIFMGRYYQNPNYCVICNSILPYNNRYRKTCSNNCLVKLLSYKNIESVAKNGGNNNANGVRGKAKYGTYKGFHCDSSWELAFVCYCLSKNIYIKRNTEGFDYVYSNKKHKYYPDFIINDTYIEIKNYYNDQVQAKIDYFPKDKKLIVLYKKDIQICIDYCKEKYGKKFWEVLYDKDKPSCNN